MPSSTTLSPDDKAKVKKAVPTSGSTNKIVTATVARVYQAEQNARAYASILNATDMSVLEADNC